MLKPSRTLGELGAARSSRLSARASVVLPSGTGHHFDSANHPRRGSADSGDRLIEFEDVGTEDATDEVQFDSSQANLSKQAEKRRVLSRISSSMQSSNPMQRKSVAFALPEEQEEEERRGSGSSGSVHDVYSPKATYPSAVNQEVRRVLHHDHNHGEHYHTIPEEDEEDGEEERLDDEDEGGAQPGGDKTKWKNLVFEIIEESE